MPLVGDVVQQQGKHVGHNGNEIPQQENEALLPRNFLPILLACVVRGCFGQERTSGATVTTWQWW